MTDRTALALAWADALESGEYEQGYQRLRTDDKYCCLGVLADIAIKRNVIEAEWRMKSVQPRPTLSGKQLTIYMLAGPDGDNEGELLPKKLTEFMGFASGDGRLVPEDRPTNVPWHFQDYLDDPRQYATLTSANDSSLVTFAAIGKAVREHFILQAAAAVTET